MASKKDDDTVVTIGANGQVVRQKLSNTSQAKTQQPQQKTSNNTVVTMKNGKVVREPINTSQTTSKPNITVSQPKINTSTNTKSQKPTTPLVYQGASINPNAPENEKLRITANNNYNQKLSAYKKAEEDYKAKRENELTSRGISADFLSRFDVDAPLEKKLTKLTREEAKKRSEDAKIYRSAKDEIQNALRDEEQAISDTYNQLKYAKYLKNYSDVENGDINLYDRTLGQVFRGAQDMFSTFTDDNRYVDENGNTTYLPTYNQLKQAKVQDSYGNDLLGGLARFGGDVAYQGAKLGTSIGLNAVAPLSGTALYFTDIYADQYKDNINAGMDNEGAMLNAFLKTGQNYIKKKLIGGIGGKLTGGDTSALENALSKGWAKIASNPKVVAVLSSMSAEAIDEFTDTYMETLIDVATRDDVDVSKLMSPDTFLEALYSGAVGGATGAMGGVNPNSLASAQNAINQRMATQNMQQNIQPNIDTQIQAKTPQIQQNEVENINNQPTMEQTQLDLNGDNNEVIQNKVDLGLKEAPEVKAVNKVLQKLQGDKEEYIGIDRLGNNISREVQGQFNDNTQYLNDTLNKLAGKETNNIPETKSDATNQIVINNNGKQTSTNIDTKTEDTGVSINGKRVAIEVPTNTHKNSLGQDVLNNINTEKVKKGDGDSRFYETITERSQFAKQEVKDRASQDDFIKHYDKITNQESLDNAINKLSQEGTSAISEFFSKNKKLTPNDTAMGIVLFEQAQNAGDYEMANNVLRKLRSNATTTAQTLQLYSVFSRMTPEGMYKYAGDQLLKAQEIFEKNKSRKWIEQNRDRWQLNPDEVEFIKSQMEKVQELNNSNEKMAEVSLNGYGVKDNGKTIKVTKERATQLEIAKIQKLIEDKIPAEKGQAAKAWFRISMLGNPKTIATRNPLGNLLISPVNTVGDYFGSAVDKLVSLKTKVRTKGGTDVPTSIKGFVEGGRESIQDKKIGVNTRDIAGNRFEIGQGKSFNENHSGILANQRNKVSKVLNKMDRGVNFVLDLGDRPFYQAAFENSLANQMKLNNIEDVDSAPQWMLDNAQQEALERTWQDDNNYTSFVLSVRKALNNLNVKGYGIGDLLIPFAKTPANLTKAIVDYSPAGLINAMTQGNNLRKSISNGQFTPQMQHQFVNQLGKAFAGSLLYVAAGALANAGVITGAADEDKDVADFMRYTLGIQPYSIVIGDSSFTYDWAQPIAAPFAIMSDLKKKLDSSNGEADLGFILKSAISSSSSILLEQSFLQGIQDVLGGYGDPVDNLLSEIEGLPARAIPTFFQQVATLVDGKQRMSYGNDGISNVLSQAKAKTPILASDLPVKRNTLGQEVERYGGENNIFNVFFNPANYSQGRATESAKEIYKIYQATNDKTILPRTVTNSIKNEDGTNLTNAQKSEFMKISGSIVDDNVKKLKDNKDYQNMSDEDKAAVIKKIVDYAYNKAREQVTNHTLASEYKKVDKAIETGYALYDYYSTKQSTKQTKTTSSNNSKNRYEEMKELGIDGETFDKFKAFVSTARGESTTGGLTKKQKILNWINSQDLTEEQKDNLYNDYVKNSKIYSSYN